MLERRAATVVETCGVRAAAEIVHVPDPAAAEAAFASTFARLGPPEILVNGAGIALSAPFLRSDLEVWRLIEPSEMAGAVAWLCLPSSASVTGRSLLVAGGELM